MPGVPNGELSRPRIRVLRDASRRDLREPSRPRPIRVYEWEPQSAAAMPVPLIVVSHGTGGSGGDMNWLVEPLVAAGFRVVAVDHHGNNYVDGYEPEGFLFVWDRPKDLSFVLDVLADQQPYGRVGAAGFSVGGYTVGALAGARLDPQAVAAVLTGQARLPPIPGCWRRYGRRSPRKSSPKRSGQPVLICRTRGSGRPSRSPRVSDRC